MIIRAVFMQIEYIFRRPYAVRRRACYPARIAAPFAARVQIFKRNALPVISADNSYGGGKARLTPVNSASGLSNPLSLLPISGTAVLSASTATAGSTPFSGANCTPAA